MRGIKPTDEALLDWFFGVGQTVFERSTAGGMFERARIFAVDKPTTTLRERKRRRLRGAQTAKPNTGADPTGEGLREAPSDPPEKWDPLKDYYSTGITARPSHGREPEVRDAPNDRDLFRYAEASRRIAAVAAIDATSAAVLKAYYGDQGAMWGRSDLGRIVAVMPLTEAGRELLRRSGERDKRRGVKRAPRVTSGNGGEAMQLADELIVLKVQPAAQRGLLAERARNQALALYGRAISLWRTTRPG